jgi:hypothetical protein
VNYPSVTQIIGFCNRDAFNGIPAGVLARAAQRGTNVHSAAALSLLGMWFEETPEIMGYIKSLNDWRRSFVEEVVAVEQELLAPKYRVQGHPDAIVRLRGDQGLTLVDWKTPKPLSPSWRLQLAGYKLIAEAEPNNFQIARVASLRLDSAGGAAKFDGYTKTLAHDKNVFLSCLNVWRYFNG